MSLIIHKQQGIEDPEFADLKKDDFLLLFMTEAQEKILRKYGNDTICIDGTHGLNSYDFQLYTLLVLDDTREGFPVAFMFTNRADELIMSKFFKALKNVSGFISPKVFMSDMEETFYTAWKKHMGVPEHRIFCAWHVLKAWRGNVLKKIKNKEKREYVQKILKTLIYELDVNTFEKILPQAMATMQQDEELKLFFEYFKSYYVNNERFKTWAYCYRIHAGVNTNMSVENFNRLLKYCYLRGKQVRRLDKTLCAILNLLRNKLFDLLIKMKRGKLVRKLQVLRRNHKKSFSIVITDINKIEDKWEVLSSEKNGFYTVKKVKECKTCQLKCLHCDSCFHEYICSCFDSSIKNNMCKHIHAVAKSEVENYPNSNKELDSTYDNDNELNIDCDLIEDQDEQEILAQVSKKSEENVSLEVLKLNLVKKCESMISCITSTDQANFVGNEIGRVITTLDAINMPTTSRATLKVQRSVPANINVVCQRKFKSTKKTKKVPGVNNKDMKEMQNLALELLGYK